MNAFRYCFDYVVKTGVKPKLSTFEKGLVKLTNKASLVIILIVNLIFVPLALYSQNALSILFFNALFFPLTLIFNKIGYYQLARHSLLTLLYSMLLTISVIRGRESGILFILIPTILLSFIFFYGHKSLYIHLILSLIISSFTLLYTDLHLPVQPYSREIVSSVFAINLLISLSLTAIFIHFIFNLNQLYQKELLELNSTKNRILSIIGHDLRSPLNSIKGLLHLLSKKNIGQEEFRQLTGHLHRNTEQLSYSLDNLLQWSVSQMKGFHPNPLSFNIQEMIENECQLFAETARLKNIRLQNNVSQGTYARADPNNITLVVRNLLNNSIKFTPEGGLVTIEAESNEKELSIHFTDTGIGISPDQLSRLFGSFKPSNSKGTKGEAGTGLGLMLCKDMVTWNKGKIWVRSDKNKGSTFSFTLPTAQGPPQNLPKDRRNQEQQA